MGLFYLPRLLTIIKGKVPGNGNPGKGKFMRIAVVQTRPALGQKRENIEQALTLLESHPAEIYVLPELAFTGYEMTDAAQARDLAEPAHEGPTVQAVADFCRRRRAWVAYGFPEASSGQVFNSGSLWGPEGRVGTYRKVHLFGREKKLFAPGDLGFSVWETPFGPVGMMICFDWFFPEAARTLALAGARLLLHPANLVLPHCPQAMITRCLENRVFAATADRTGADPGDKGPVRFIGQSQMVSPRGEVLVRLGEEEGVGTVDINLEEARDKRLSSGNDLFQERRPPLYRL